MKIDVLTLFRMGLIGAAHGWGQNGLSSKNLSHISYNNEIWHSLPHLLSLQKYINHVAYPLRSADISIFSTEISSFCYIKKLKFKLHFNTWFLIPVILCFSLWSLFYETWLQFWWCLQNWLMQVCDVIVSFHGVANKNQNYHLDHIILQMSSCDQSLS